MRSAVLLEQAALCFLRSAPASGGVVAASWPSPSSSSSAAAVAKATPLLRKYGFHMILAGHRFGKSGQKRHAARAYQLALQVRFT